MAHVGMFAVPTFPAIHLVVELPVQTREVIVFFEELAMLSVVRVMS